MVVTLLGHPIVSVACGGAHTAAVTNEGVVYTWGRGKNGRLGHGDATSQDAPKPISALRQLLGPREKVVGVRCGWNFTLLVGGTARTVLCCASRRAYVSE